MYWSSILSALPGAVLLVTRIEWLGIQWLGKPRNRDRAAAAQIEIVGDDGPLARAAESRPQALASGARRIALAGACAAGIAYWAVGFSDDRSHGTGPGPTSSAIPAD